MSTGHQCPIRVDTSVRRSRSRYLDPDQEDEDKPGASAPDSSPAYYTFDELLECGFSEEQACHVMRHFREGDPVWLGYLVCIGLSRKNATTLLERLAEDGVQAWYEYLRANPKRRPGAYLWRSVMEYGDVAPPAPT